MIERPLKICMITTFYPPYHFGGDGVCVYRLSEALAARGHRVDVIHSADAFYLEHPAEPEIEFRHHDNVRRHVLRTRPGALATLAAHQLGRPAFYAPAIRRVLDSVRPDVIHFHNVSLVGGPGVLRLGQAVKLYTAHEYWLICPTHVLFRFDREPCRRRTCLRCTLHARRPPQVWRASRRLARCLDEVDCLLTPSRFAALEHRAHGIDGPIEILPHFVPGPARTGTPGPEDAGSGKPFFLYVGRLEKLKGVQDLLDVFSDYRGAELRIVGDGAHAGTLRRQARNLEHVHFLGPRHPAAIGDLYRRALGLLAPSLCYETFGMTVAEALAHGTPAIVRHHGALPELIEQSGAGYTFRDARECRRALESLQADPDRRAELGRRGQRTAERLWSAEAHLERYLGLIASWRARKEGRTPASGGRR